MTPTPILVVLPFHKGDALLLNSLLTFMRELNPSGHKRNNAILLCEDDIDPPVMESIKTQARSLFRSVRRVAVVVPSTHKGWPRGANVMFETAAKQVMMTCKHPWLWMEPDCVPLKPDWLSRIEDEYFLASRLLLGAKVKGKSQNGEQLEHMSGIAVYPPTSLLLFGVGVDIASMSDAFDVALAGKTLTRMQATPLIQHYWGTHETPPTFAKAVTSASPPGTVGPNIVDWQNAVLFHRCKDGSLFPLVRAQLGLKTPGASQAKPVEQVKGVSANDAPSSEGFDGVFANEEEVGESTQPPSIASADPGDTTPPPPNAVPQNLANPAGMRPPPVPRPARRGPAQQG